MEDYAYPELVGGAFAAEGDAAALRGDVDCHGGVVGTRWVGGSRGSRDELRIKIYMGSEGGRLVGLLIPGTCVFVVLSGVLLLTARRKD